MIHCFDSKSESRFIKWWCAETAEGKLTGLSTELFLCLVFPQVCCLRIKVTSRPAEASVSGSPSAGCTRGVPSSSTICTAPPRARWPSPCTISPPTDGSHQLQLSALTDNFSLVSLFILNDRNQLLIYEIGVFIKYRINLNYEWTLLEQSFSFKWWNKHIN